MPDSDDGNEKSLLVYLVENPVLADAEAVGIRLRESSVVAGERIFGQRVKSAPELPVVSGVQGA